MKLLVRLFTKLKMLLINQEIYNKYEQAIKCIHNKEYKNALLLLNNLKTYKIHNQLKTSINNLEKEVALKLQDKYYAD